MGTKRRWRVRKTSVSLWTTAPRSFSCVRIKKTVCVEMCRWFEYSNYSFGRWNDYKTVYYGLLAFFKAQITANSIKRIWAFSGTAAVAGIMIKNWNWADLKTRDEGRMCTILYSTIVDVIIDHYKSGVDVSV